MRNGFFAGAFTVVALGFAACDEKTCDDTLSCGATTTDGGPGPSCKAGGPKEDPACVTDAFGLFVAPTGSDDAAGTKAAPVKTIGAALKKRGGKTALFVCEGRYAEQVTLGAGEQGISIYGGLACDTWAYTGGKPDIGGAAGLRADGITKATTLMDLRFRAADAANPGESSIAATLVSSGGLVFQRVAFTAGAGKKGADGAPGVTATADKALGGESAVGVTAPLAKTCTCTEAGQALGVSTGGGGGGPLNGSGAAGMPNISPSEPAGSTGAGGIGGGDCTGGLGKRGSAGPSGGDGKPASAVGSLKDDGWTPGNGQPGIAGQIGQGGGGGAARDGAGGGGGCGGCPGGFGTGGAGGGASAALLATGSGSTFFDCEFSSSAGAAGSDGRGGAAGAAGGGGGGGGTAGSFLGCAGGDGGKGGDGGAGAGGAGGISVGVLYKGPKPTLTNPTFTLGAAGLGGKGGKPGVNDGPPGVSKDVFEAP